jgi:hypothetical protein
MDTGRDRSMTGAADSNNEAHMKALAISLVAGAALGSVTAVPASAMPAANLAAAANDLALGQSVQCARNDYRYRYYGYAPNYYGTYGYYGYAPGYYAYAPGYYGYGAGYSGYAQNCHGYGTGPNSPCYP